MLSHRQKCTEELLEINCSCRLASKCNLYILKIIDYLGSGAVSYQSKYNLKYVVFHKAVYVICDKLH